jgi:hypothetical protein
VRPSRRQRQCETGPAWKNSVRRRRYFFFWFEAAGVTAAAGSHSAAGFWNLQHSHLAVFTFLAAGLRHFARGFCSKLSKVVPVTALHLGSSDEALSAQLATVLSFFLYVGCGYDYARFRQGGICYLVGAGKTRVLRIDGKALLFFFFPFSFSSLLRLLKGNEKDCLLLGVCERSVCLYPRVRRGFCYSAALRACSVQFAFASAFITLYHWR